MYTSETPPLRGLNSRNGHENHVCLISSQRVLYRLSLKGLEEIQAVMQMKLHHLTITSFFLVAFSLDHAFAGKNITVQNAWIREAPPTIKIMAAYLEIENTSGKELVLVAAKSNEFERIEFHLSKIKDGIASMSQQDTIVIAPNSTFTFKPESYHLMLFNNTVPMPEGESTSIQLTFENGETYEFDIMVKRADSTDAHQHHKHY